MKSLSWILCVIFAFSGLAFADTTFVAAGNVSGAWSAEHSPYVVQGDIVIPPNETLSIGPGVRVFFSGYYGLFDSLGTLTVNGVEGDSVVFTTDTLAHPERWRGIGERFNPWQFGQSWHLSYCVIEFAGTDTTTGTIFMNKQLLEITHSTFRYNRGNDCVVLRASGLTVAACLFEHNVSGSGGGARLGRAGFVNNSVFRFNTARDAGGGAVCDTVVVRECEFYGNTAGRAGGGMYSSHSNVDSCSFHDNTSLGYGGGVVLDPNLLSTFALNTISHNHADSVGGGIWAGSDSVSIYWNLIFANTAGSGGGCYLVNGPEITACTIVGNTATIHGGGIADDPGFASRYLTNTIVAFNHGGGIALPADWYANISHCAFFGNTDGDFFDNSDPDLGRWTRTNANGDSCDPYYNIYFDPLFVDSTENFHLTAASPCIDAGTAWHDPDGTLADIGTFYFDQRISDAGAPVLPIPSGFVLHQNYPNPFNSETRIAFELPRASDVRLEVFDLLGRLVTTLVSQEMNAGRHEVSFSTDHVASGVYLYRLHAGEFVQTMKMIVMK